MPTAKKLQRILGVCVLVLAFSRPVHAANRNMSAEFLCDYGKRLYKRGERSDALHEFHKALIIDPDNAVARDYINRLNASFYSGTSSPKARTQSVPVRRSQVLDDLAEAGLIRDHKNTVRPLVFFASQAHPQIFAEEIALMRKAGENIDLKYEMEQVKEQARQSTAGYRRQVNHLKSDLTVKEQRLNELKELVKAQDRKTQSHLARLKEREARLQFLQKKAVEINAALENRTISCEGELKDVERQVNQLKINLVSQDLEFREKIDSLEDSLYSAQRKLRYLNDAVALKDMDLARLASLESEHKRLKGELQDNELIVFLKKQDRRVADLKEQLANTRRNNQISSPKPQPAMVDDQRSLEKDVLLEQKKNQVSRLESEIADVKARLTLTQKIIQEKEQQIRELNSALSKIEAASMNP